MPCPAMPFLLGMSDDGNINSTLDASIDQSIAPTPTPAPTATTQTSDGRRAGPRNAHSGGLDSGSGSLAPADANLERRGRAA